MRPLTAFAALALASCGDGSDVPSDWDPLELPAGVEGKLSSAMGVEEVSFIVSPPSEESRMLGWTCGLVAPQGSDDMRFFVYESGADAVRLQPEIDPDAGQSEGLRLLSFMEYKRPCEEN